MFFYISEFVKRHRKKIIIFGVVVGGAIWGSRYAQRRFIEWQEKEAKEFLQRTKKQHHFESTEKTCNQTIISLSSTLKENIFQLINCEEIIKQLRENPSNKVDLWQELKVLVFTRVATLVYAGTLLVITLRIQLNIIGGHIYCRQSSQGSECSKGTNNLQERYLSQCHYFLNEGIKQLVPLIKEKVLVALKDASLTQEFTLNQIENICWGIQTSINDDPKNPIKIMPTLLFNSDYEKEDTLIKEMMLDTIDLLQNTEVTDLAFSCVSRGFSNLIDKIADFFLPDFKSGSLSRPGMSKGPDLVNFPQPNKLSKPLAKIIPIINTYGCQNSGDTTESWISPFIYMDKVKVLGANIYESYSCSKL